jgi:DNA primase
MQKSTQLKTLETYIRAQSTLFKNVTTNGEWVNFSCLLAKHSEEHRFKDDGNPSAGITVADDDKVYYKCFTCKHQGPFLNTIDRFELKSGQQLVALRELVDKEEELPDFEYRVFVKDRIKPQPLLFTNIFEDINKYPEAQKYLLEREVSPTTAKNIGLEYDPDSRRIVFPVRDTKGVTYGYTGRAIDATNKVKIKDYHFQKSHFILGMELWRELPTVIVEGLFAYAHLHEITKGKYFPYNIGAIMGSSISEEQVNLLIEFGKPIYCLLDDDKPGRTGLFGTRHNGVLKKEGLIHKTKDHIPTFIMKYPEGKTDPDSLTYDEVFAMIQKSLMVV